MLKEEEMLKEEAMRKLMTNLPLKIGEASASGNKEFFINGPKSNSTVQVFQGNLYHLYHLQDGNHHQEIPRQSGPLIPLRFNFFLQQSMHKI